MAQPKTLFEYYQQRGQALPGVKERAKTFEDLGLGSSENFTGTTDQNVSLLSRLQSMPVTPRPVSNPPVAPNLPVSATGQPQATTSTPSVQDRYQKLLESLNSAFQNLPSKTKSDYYTEQLAGQNVEPQRQQLQSLDQRIATMEQAITNSEQDIRKRTIQSGGLVTESQTQRLVASEQQPLINEYRNLLSQRNLLAQNVAGAESRAATLAGMQYEGAQQPLENLKTRLGLEKDITTLTQGGKTVDQLITQYPDAGILRTDTPEIASLKAAQSSSFKAKYTNIRAIVDPIYGGISYYNAKGEPVGNPNAKSVASQPTPSGTGVSPETKPTGQPQLTTVPSVIKPAVQTIEGTSFIDMSKITQRQLPLAQQVATKTNLPLLAKDDVNAIQGSYATYLSAKNLMNTILKTAKNLITAKNPIDILTQGASIQTGALTRTNTDAKVFLDTTKAFSSLLTRAAGEKGVLTNMDVQRIINGLPNIWDTKDIMQEKAVKFDDLFRSQFQSSLQAYIGQAGGQMPQITGGQNADIGSLRTKYGY